MNSQIGRLVILLVLVITTATTGFAQSRPDQALRGMLDELERNNRAAGSQKKAPPQNQLGLQVSFAPLVKSVAPAVVNVYAAREIKRRRSPFEGDPFFEQFFGRSLGGGRSRKRIEKSLGSGVIVGQRGIVVTNYHVIKNATEIKVRRA